MAQTIFLKLGGSLITDKTGVEAVRDEVLARLAQEIAHAQQASPQLRLLIGHGSGSFGHVPAAQHGTRQGVQTAAQWRGFAEVSRTAAALNKRVLDALQAAGVSALTFQPSASAMCTDGHITRLAAEPIQQALAVGLTPVVYGDVAFDTVRGGTIIATEEIMQALAAALRPDWLLLAGETIGVYDAKQRLIPEVTRKNLDHIADALGGSRGTDVTGGMLAKVHTMLGLVAQYRRLSVRIFSGLVAGNCARLLIEPKTAVGTLIYHDD